MAMKEREKNTPLHLGETGRGRERVRERGREGERVREKRRERERERA